MACARTLPSNCSDSFEEPPEVAYHGPRAPDLPEWGLSSVALAEETLRASDCVIIATGHAAPDLSLVVDAAAKIVDLRNAVRRRLGHSNVSLPKKADVL